MRSLAALAIAGIVAGTAVGPPRALADGLPLQPSTAPAEHVWTTDDLERLYGPAATPTPIDPAELEAEQRRIDLFLERQYARIDADRDYDLARSLALLPEVSQVDLPRWAGFLGGRYFGFRGSGFDRRSVAPRHGDGIRGLSLHGGNARPGPAARSAGRLSNRLQLPANIPKLTFHDPMARSVAAHCDAAVPTRSRR